MKYEKQFISLSFWDILIGIRAVLSFFTHTQHSLIRSTSLWYQDMESYKESVVDLKANILREIYDEIQKIKVGMMDEFKSLQEVMNRLVEITKNIRVGGGSTGGGDVQQSTRSRLCHDNQRKKRMTRTEKMKKKMPRTKKMKERQRKNYQSVGVLAKTSTKKSTWKDA